LLESELFGYVRGAFTGADRDRKGLFEAADGGTIFLDEIGELPLAVQVKLLRVLENREIKRVGCPEATRIDIRVVAATNRDLHDMVDEETFRGDLYYRLNVGSLHLPPLRERPDDIEPLTRHFIDLHNQRLGRKIAGASPKVLERFRAHHWPGNVRELANVIERAMVMAQGAVILPEHLPPTFFDVPSVRRGEGSRLPELSLEAAERDQILRALQASGGKRIEAARLLGLSRRTLYRKLDRYGITR
jgi:two-component system response regulator AtoC